MLPWLVSVFGTLALAVPYLAPAARDDVAALILLPGGAPGQALRDIGALGVPIRDIRWNGRLVELDIADLPPAQRLGLARRLSVPAMQIAVRPAALCATPPLQEDAK